ncbi:MAG: type II secretion system protein GspD [Alphaproteobacteria bacterium]
MGGWQRRGHRRARGGVLSVGLTGVLLVAAGCVSEPRFGEDPELKTLIDGYRERSADAEQQRQRREEAAIRRLEIARDGTGSGFFVSVDLKDASVASIVERILERTSVPYNFSGVRLHGRATARFDRLPLVAALNQLVNPQGISLDTQDGVLVFRYGGQITAPTAAVPPTLDAKADALPTGGATNGVVYQEVTLRYLSVDDAVTLLEGLYSASGRADDGNDDDDGDDDEDEDDDDSASASINFGALGDLNAVYLAGRDSDVRSAVAVLNRADREVVQVLIEVLVVELDVQAVVDLGSALTGGASGNFSDISLSAGSLGGNIGFSFLEGANNLVQLTALIDLLVSQDKAQILSRPYLATRSNKQATIEIVNDRTFRIDTTQDGAAIASTDTVSAGVTLQVTPVVSADEQIRLDLQVEESQFVPTVGEALVEVDRNTAQTAMTVRSGQTIVVGGLNLRRLDTTNSGLPWLRRIPLLNLLAADQSSFDQNKEVVVYLTPYVWNPNLDPPIARPTTLVPKSAPFTGFERLEGVAPRDGSGDK